MKGGGVILITAVFRTFVQAMTDAAKGMFYRNR